MQIRQLSFNLGLGTTPNPTEQPEIDVELYRIYNAINALALYLDTYTGMAPVTTADAPATDPAETSRLSTVSKFWIEAAATIIPGDILHINSSGQAVLAQAVAGHTLRGQLCALTAAVSTGWLQVTPIGILDLFVGLTPGNYYYLSTTAGGLAAAPPASGSKTIQYLGYAISATELYFAPSLEYQTSPA